MNLQSRLDEIPETLAAYPLELANDGGELVYTYDTQGERTGITALLGDLGKAGIRFKDLQTSAELARGHLRQPGEGRRT